MARVEPDTALGGRYRLVRRIASGGMGSVWEAEDTVLSRRVAVKLPDERLASEPRFAARFRREALAAAGLSHPGVARVFDYGGDADGPPYIVMELVEGQTLSERIRTQGRLPQDEAIRIAVAIADALQAAHDSGIVHRDVKPGNVMITPSGDVRVLDFGIAAAAGATLSSTGARMGTATYISPEQARGDPPTAASDVYSLGVVFYEMLTGAPPFVADSPVAVARLHVDSPAPSVRERAPDVDPRVAAACERTLAKDPGARPPSAGAFAELLTDRTPVMPTLPAAPPAPRRRVPLWPLALLLLTAAVVWGGFLVYGAVTGSPEPTAPPSVTTPPVAAVAVPSVTGLSRQEAVAAIEGAGLTVADLIPVEGDKNIVVDTDPPEGTRLAPGSAVTLYVGSTPPKGEDNHGHGGGNGGDNSGPGGGGD